MDIRIGVGQPHYLPSCVGISSKLGIQTVSAPILSPSAQGSGVPLNFVLVKPAWYRYSLSASLHATSPYSCLEYCKSIWRAYWSSLADEGILGAERSYLATAPGT